MIPVAKGGDVCHVLNCTLDYSRAITASANLLIIYLLLLLCGSGYVRDAQLKRCHFDTPGVE